MNPTGLMNQPPPSQVGNEFSSVEALWSQFENVMARDPEEGKTENEGEGEGDRSKNESP